MRKIAEGLTNKVSAVLKSFFFSPFQLVVTVNLNLVQGNKIMFSLVHKPVLQMYRVNTNKEWKVSLLLVVVESEKFML